MLKAGKIVALFGLIVTAIGLVAGFTLMMQQSPLAKFFLMLTPVGFFLLFTGVMTAILFGEAKSLKRSE